MVDHTLERGRRFSILADLVQDGKGHGTPHAVPFEEALPGAAGHAEVLSYLALAVQCRVGARVDRNALLRPGL